MYVPELNVVYISLMSQSKSHVNSCGGIKKNRKWKIKTSVLIDCSLINELRGTFRPELITQLKFYLMQSWTNLYMPEKFYDRSYVKPIQDSLSRKNFLISRN